MLFKRWMNNDNEDRSYEDKLSDIKELTANADAIVIGAGADISILIDIWMLQSQYMIIYMNWLRIRIILLLQPM